MTVLNNPKKEKYSVNEAKKQRVTVVVWLRAWRRRKESGKRGENRVPGRVNSVCKGPEAGRSWVILWRGGHSCKQRAKGGSSHSRA